jgi:putative hydrolase of the HAD superfamily
MTTATATASTTPQKKVTTLIFDVDDTLYDIGTGFTSHRNGEAAWRFMMEFLDFPDLESARLLRDEFFERYHSTAKALQMAEQQGRLPPRRDRTAAAHDSNSAAAAPLQPWKEPRFDPVDLAEYWASNLNFKLLDGPYKALLQDLQECNLNIVAFSNGPRKYVIRVLQELGLWETVFQHSTLFAVDDVLPYCKPEKEAFDAVFAKIGVTADECVLFEDSMKNIRKAKELGVQTVLITGAGNSKRTKGGQFIPAAAGDAPVEGDPAVDCAIETVQEMRATLPGLWETPAVFAPFKHIM